MRRGYVHVFKNQMSVEIYTRDFCGYCEAAKDLLRCKGVTFKEIDVTGDRQRRSEMVARSGGGTTVPQIFVGSRHLGGCEELYGLERAGKLDALLGRETEAHRRG
jgi:glutaredoxin 3